MRNTTIPKPKKNSKFPTTYTPGREKMFRRWLLSMPEGQEKDISAPNSMTGWNNSNSVVLVGKGSLGIDPENPMPGDELDKVTRAYLTSVGKTGKHAWWIGPENHKARIDKAKSSPRLAGTSEAWETSQGDTAEVGVGALDGFKALDDNKTLGDKLITTQTLRPALVATGIDADVAEADMQKHFFDLTASSRGVLASVRTGHLKKDLSLLFEQDKSELPSPYRFNPGDLREPSIRPMSLEIATKPKLPNRHFASWTRMRHFYRMYRQDSDAEARSFASGGTDGTAGLNWTGAKPWADTNVNTARTAWGGYDTYEHFPILSHITYILSLKTDAHHQRCQQRKI